MPPVLVFKAVNKVKEQETCFSLSFRNKVNEPETKFSLSHGNLPFWFLKP